MKTMISRCGTESRTSTDKEGASARRRFRPRVVAISALLFCSAPFHYAHAELPEMGVFANAQELSDEVLGETRGKFVSAGQIMTFGVKMVTEWITSTGETINASGTLAVSMISGQPTVSFEPVISVHQTQPVGQPTSQGNNFVSGGQGLENITGVVQSIQVAGNTNGIGNSIGISVKRYNESGGAPPAGNSASNLNVTTPSGNTAAVALANNGLSVNVNVVDQGQAQQAIRSISQGSGQVLQSVRLGGDLNQIRNLINLDIQTRNNAVSSSANTQQILSSLRQLSQTTPF